MTVLGNRVWAAVIAVASVQSAVLGWMVWERVQLLRHGREITLETAPVDPRSLFRGDYVRLGYEISRVDAALLDDPGVKRGELPRNGVLYVTLKQGEDGKWKPRDISRSLQPSMSASEIVLKARFDRIWAANLVNVRYGIERYYVPEGSGREIEDLGRNAERRISVVVAVDAGGNAAIKRLMLDGKVLREEAPL